MRWELNRDKDQKQLWHNWFAWHPVRAEGHIVWLEVVCRRLIYGPAGESPIAIYSLYTLDALSRGTSYKWDAVSAPHGKES
jgi:hypothetical protein